MRCVNPKQGARRAEEMHAEMCGVNAGSLYRRIQRLGCFWPDMKRECDAIQEKCEACCEHREEVEVSMVEDGDWRRAFLEFLESGVLPADPIEAANLKKRAGRYFVLDGHLFKRRFNGEIMRCVGKEEGEKILKSMHEGECGRHQGGKALSIEVLKAGYYWPALERDAGVYVKTCQLCQRHDNSIHAPAVGLHSTSSPYPFHTWAFDFVGPINPPSRGKKWILAATEQFTKWVEATALKEANAEAVVVFLKEHIICRFGLP